MKKETNSSTGVLAGLFVIGSLVSTFFDWINIDLYYYEFKFSFWKLLKLTIDVDNYSRSYGMSDVSSFVREYKAVILIFAVLLVALGIIAFIDTTKGLKVGISAYFVLTLAFPLAPMLFLSEFLSETMGSYADIISDFISPTDYLGLGGWLCPAFALIAFVIALSSGMVSPPSAMFTSLIMTVS